MKGFVCFLTAGLCLAVLPLAAQDIESQLSGSSSAQGFTVKSGVGTSLFSIRGDGKTGIGTATPEFRLSLDGDGGFLAKGTINAGDVLTTSGAGARMIWYPRKAAFRAGEVSGTQWDDANIGFHSVALGHDSKATASGSIALGYSAIASNLNSIAFGDQTIASGQGSSAIGRWSHATGSNATAVGYDATASGDYSIAMGPGTIANGYYLTAMGLYNVGGGNPTTWVATDPLFEIGNAHSGPRTNALTVYKNASIAIGPGSTATGQPSWSMGAASAASASYAVALGRSNTASGQQSTAMGWNTVSSGYSSTSMGFGNTASGDNSLVVGINSVASGWSAMALGANVTASGDRSIALGSYASTNGQAGACVIGDNSTTTNLAANLPNKLRARFANGFDLFTNSALTTGVFLGANSSSWQIVSDSTKKCEMKIVDAESMLARFAALRLGSWNYTSLPGKEYRHYGPMAQEWFAAFGHDGVGTIGNDTTLASADVDGVLCIAVQALEKRTSELREEMAKVSRLRQQLTALQEEKAVEVDELRSQLSALRQEMQLMRREFATYRAQQEDAFPRLVHRGGEEAVR